MTTTPHAYRGGFSARSRRLRTVGLMLLIAAVGMALFGATTLMPGLTRSIRAEAHTAASINQHGGRVSAEQQARLRRAKRVALVKIAFAYAYWSVCGLLVVALLVTAWLDMREVQRNYLKARRALLEETLRTGNRE